MGVAAIPVAGVYISACALYRSAPERLAECSTRFKVKNFAAWMLGAAVGSGSVIASGFIIPVPALEGLAASVLAFVLLHNWELLSQAKQGREDPTAA
ncbi:hypothetical protein [Sinorhizobium meliloti]|uniref:hypothetical protein n=1 Tax=Rhizobium meliloti TaxID=382 RepID=UPI0013E2D313|nr:hypothetical protein [Sinorhizobium meliloti]